MQYFCLETLVFKRDLSDPLEHLNQRIDLEDLISTNLVDGEFRFDLLFKTDGQSPVTIFVDTKNYSSASNIFTDMSQIKAYFKRIGSFEEFRIVQQARPGITLNNVQKAILKDVKGVHDENKISFNKIIYNENTIADYEDFATFVKSDEFLNSDFVKIIKLTK